MDGASAATMLARAATIARSLATRMFSRWLHPGALVALAALAAIERVRTVARHLRGARPRLIWGPVPLISLKYWSGAMRQRGYKSVTCVSTVYPSYSRADFDVYRDQFLGEGPLAEMVRDYAVFAWALRHGDVFIRFFDGGFLRDTPLQWQESKLLRIAAKKTVVLPYGGDVAVPGHLGGLEEDLFADYPYLREQADLTRRRILHASRSADIRIRNYQIGFVPNYNVVWPTQIAIDTSSWDQAEGLPDADGRDGQVVILHAPNHRNIKGTRHFERAVAELRKEGFEIDFQILEGLPNEQIREAMRASDIALDQCLLPGYAMFAIEAMATGKPVMANISALPDDVRDRLGDCPIVDVNPESVRDELRRLVEDSQLRRRLGSAGREFVMRRHSYEAVGAEWEAIFDHLWRGRPLPRHLLPAAS
jgi:glycosyltransferase involved in cell wall biosynthesis